MTDFDRDVRIDEAAIRPADSLLAPCVPVESSEGAGPHPRSASSGPPGITVVGVCRQYPPYGLTCREAGFSPENWCDKCKPVVDETGEEIVAHENDLILNDLRAEQAIPSHYQLLNERYGYGAGHEQGWAI